MQRFIIPVNLLKQEQAQEILQESGEGPVWLSVEKQLPIMVEHAWRLATMAGKVGPHFGLTASELEALILLAKMHDIGKIAIPEQILLKPGKLTSAEWLEIQKHPEIGYRIAKASGEFAHIAECILAHHERWDGNGYPRGLKGNQIPKLARILAIIDAYDVMIHKRPYKEAMSKFAALKELRRCAGTQFDPELTLEFIRLISSQDDEAR